MLPGSPLVNLIWALILNGAICFCRLASHGEGSQVKKRGLCPQEDEQHQPKPSGREFRSRSARYVPWVRMVAWLYGSSHWVWRDNGKANSKPMSAYPDMYFYIRTFFTKTRWNLMEGILAFATFFSPTPMLPGQALQTPHLCQRGISFAQNQIRLQQPCQPRSKHSWEKEWRETHYCRHPPYNAGKCYPRKKCLS